MNSRTWSVEKAAREIRQFSFQWSKNRRNKKEFVDFHCHFVHIRHGFNGRLRRVHIRTTSHLVDTAAISPRRTLPSAATIKSGSSSWACRLYDRRRGNDTSRIFCWYRPLSFKSIAYTLPTMHRSSADRPSYVYSHSPFCENCYNNKYAWSVLHTPRAELMVYRTAVYTRCADRMICNCHRNPRVWINN